MGRIFHQYSEGSFSQGLKLVPHIEEKLEEHELLLDRHRVLIFYCKIACLYFGAGQFERCIDYLNKIINWKVDLRTDLQCYARLLHLIGHYELGNDEILDYLIRSVYRFMAKMQNLSVVEKEVFRFLQQAFRMNRSEVRRAFMVMVTHEMGFAREVGDQIIFVENGAIVEQGPARLLFSNPQKERTRLFLIQIL